MKYINVSAIKKEVNNAGLQIGKKSLEEMDIKFSIYLQKLIKTVRKGRINPEEIRYVTL